MQDIIGIGGIVATVVVGIITCIVTWKVAKKSIAKRKLNYRVDIFPILAQTDLAKELKVSYNGEVLKNPCLVVIAVKNTGNASVENPPIEIYCRDSLLIPAYIEDIPDGYEDKWKVITETKSKVKISAEFINPKQEMKIRLYADLNNEEPKVTCPKQDLEFMGIEDELKNRIARILLDAHEGSISVKPFNYKFIQEVLKAIIK